jgi:hypothetical protein
MTNGNADHRHVRVVVARAERTESAALCSCCGMDCHAAPDSLLRSFEWHLRAQNHSSGPSANCLESAKLAQGFAEAVANAEPCNRAVANAELLRFDASDPMASQVGTGPSDKRLWTR